MKIGRELKTARHLDTENAKTTGFHPLLKKCILRYHATFRTVSVWIKLECIQL